MRLSCSLVSLLLLTLPACAQHAGQGSAAPLALDAVLDIQDVIAGQMAAFRMGDAAGAYAYAVPSIQATFTTPEQFSAMVALGYGQIFAAYDYEFGATAGTMAQAVWNRRAMGRGASRPCKLYPPRVICLDLRGAKNRALG